MATKLKLALMIDGDNAQASLLPQMLAEVSKYGTIAIRRVYSDWTEPQSKSWKDTLLDHALQPIQQFRYTTGKNATDSALIIDAMDILHTTGINGFCIASSDSDFTRLATRIREQNLFVIGIGRSTTPRAFVNACDVFVYTENLLLEDTVGKTEVSASASAAKAPSEEVVTAVKSQKRLMKLFRTAFDSAVQDDGWALLSSVGSSLRQLDPAFDPRTYGHKQLLPLVQAHPKLIEIRKEKDGPVNGPIYIRLKEVK